MGENVNLAGRVESYTVGGQIYISEHTANRINEHLDIAGKDSFMPKGAKSEVTIYDIWGVGDTHIESVNTIKAWINMQKEVRVPFYKLEGKCVTEGKYEGQIIALSDDRKCAKLVVETTFTDRQNIMLDIGGDLYAKVIEQTEDYYILRFTSTPEHFNEWVDETTHNFTIVSHYGEA
jgi:adenylate cyclase